jgi:hypothetical protein
MKKFLIFYIVIELLLISKISDLFGQYSIFEEKGLISADAIGTSRVTRDISQLKFLAKYGFLNEVSDHSAIVKNASFYEPWSLKHTYFPFGEQRLPHPQAGIVFIIAAISDKYIVDYGYLINGKHVLCQGGIVDDYPAEQLSIISLSLLYNNFKSTPFSLVVRKTKLVTPSQFNPLTILTLDRPLGCFFGWYGFGYGSESPLTEEFNMNRIDISTSIINEYSGKCHIVTDDTIELLNQFDEYNHSELTRSATNALYGISNYSRGNIDNPYKYLGFTRINSHSFSQIMDVINQDCPSNLDLDVFSVEMSDEVINAGDHLSDLFIHIANYSRENFIGDLNLRIRFTSKEKGNTVFEKDYSVNTTINKIFRESILVDPFVIPESIEQGNYFISCEILNHDYDMGNNKSAEDESFEVFISNETVTSGNPGDKFSEKFFVFYSQGQLIIKSLDGGNFSAQVIDTFGRVVNHIDIDTNEFSLSTETFVSGIYIVKIISNSEIYTNKIMVGS